MLLNDYHTDPNRRPDPAIAGVTDDRQRADAARTDQKTESLVVANTPKTETTSKIERALCLLEVYNDKLFRGKAGGRTWGQYLQSIDLAKLGFVNGLDTETAVNWMNYAALCAAIRRLE